MLMTRCLAVAGFLTGALALGPGAAGAAAQDTTRVGRDTAARDTTQVRNPPGYQGMERDTTVFPSRTDTAATDTAGVTDRTGRTDRTGVTDTLGVTDTVNMRDTSGAIDMRQG